MPYQKNWGLCFVFPTYNGTSLPVRVNSMAQKWLLPIFLPFRSKFCANLKLKVGLTKKILHLFFASKTKVSHWLDPGSPRGLVRHWQTSGVFRTGSDVRCVSVPTSGCRIVTCHAEPFDLQADLGGPLYSNKQIDPSPIWASKGGTPKMRSRVAPWSRTRDPRGGGLT